VEVLEYKSEDSAPFRGVTRQVLLKTPICWRSGATLRWPQGGILPLSATGTSMR